MYALCHKPTYAVQQICSLLDDLVRQCEQLVGNLKAECLGCREIDHELKLFLLLYQQIGQRLAVEDAPRIYCTCSIRYS